MTPVLILQVASTWTMVGVIWFVQIVHYPLMSRADRDGFPAYAAAHSRRTTFVVAPPMLIEAATSLLAVVGADGPVRPGEAWIGLALVGVIWLSTAFLQVPGHRILGRGFEAAAHASLVATNWIRTAAWSGRGILVLIWAVRAIAAGD